MPGLGRRVHRLWLVACLCRTPTDEQRHRVVVRARILRLRLPRTSPAAAPGSASGGSSCAHRRRFEKGINMPSVPSSVERVLEAVRRPGTRARTTSIWHPKHVHRPFVPHRLRTLTFTDTVGTQRTTRFDNIQDLEDALELHGKDVAAFLVELIQGEAASSFPRHPTSLPSAHSARSTTWSSSATRSRQGLGGTWASLFRIGRCREISAGHHFARPGIERGVYVSAVLANTDDMLYIQTAGNPLGCAVALTALSARMSICFVPNCACVELA
ncbi:hypothetical protein C8F01DRAFT_465586 [Mycena amicta]|nr:hypothetical protein C8F01DRAFT_465586 [Mycena amicta]